MTSTVLIIGACGENDGTPASSPTTSPTTQPQEPTSTSALPTQTEPDTPTSENTDSRSAEPDEPTSLPDWGTDDVTVPFDGDVPPVPTAVDIRIADHPVGDYDRVAIEFEGLPGYEVGYREEVVYQGSGQTVDLDGDAFLQLTFDPARTHDDNGDSTLPAPPVDPVDVDYETLEAYVLNGDFEGQVSIALGLSDKVGFDVDHFREASGNYVVFVDVRHD